MWRQYLGEIKHKRHCGEFIQDNMYQILSESVEFYKIYDENMLAYFFIRTRYCNFTKYGVEFSHGNVETLFILVIKYL